MRTVFASISLVLSLLVGYLYFQNKNQQRDLAQAYNALRDLKWQQERNRNELYKSWTEIGEKPRVGGSITWEAKMPDGEMYTFSTFCRKSIEFTKSCEAMLENYGMSDLEAMHK